MKTATPSECLTRLELFNKRIDRLKADNYTLPRLRTQDLNALVFDMRGLKWWISVAVFNKNQERAKAIIDQAKSNWQYADKLRDEQLFNNPERFYFAKAEKRKKGTYVSRAVYQKQVEENRKLLADIKTLVYMDDSSQSTYFDVSKKWRKHFSDQDAFRRLLRKAAGIYKMEHPEQFPDMKGAIVIPDSLVKKLADFIHPDNLAWFKSLKYIHGTYSPVLKKGPIPHPVHLREGMQIRNFLREQEECKGWTDNDFDNYWTTVIDLAVKLKIEA